MTGARRRFFAAALASLLAGAALGRPRAIAAAPAATASGIPVTDGAMLDETDALAGALAATRGVRTTIGFRRRLVDAGEAREASLAVVRSAYAPREMAIEQKMLQRMGLLPAGADYLSLIADPAARPPAGFYDPAARRLYVPSWIDLPAQRPALAHELAHALQDQRVGLRRFLMIEPDGRRGLDLDARLAREALIEGDASLLAMEALDPRGAFPAPLEIAELVQRMRAGLGGGAEKTAGQDPEAAGRETKRDTGAGGDAPPLLRQILAFPYIDGFAFVAGVRGLHAWPAVDALWTQPPESTTQVLHPEEYERRARPLAITARPLPSLAASYKLGRVDTLGELVVRVWLSPVASPEVAERAAAGWRGDRMAVYLPASPAAAGPAGDAPPAVLAWLTAWDSDADADDFLQVAGARLAELAAGREAGVPGAPGAHGSTAAPIAADRPTVFTGADSRAVFALQRRGTLVALLLGAPPAALPSLTAMLNDWPPRALPPAAPARPARPHREKTTKGWR